MKKAILITVLFTAMLTGIANADDPKLTVKPYGYFKLDMAYDTARTNDGNFAMWVNNNGGGDDDNEFNMTARQTRLGANISYEGLDDVSVTGRIEMDFYGAGTENKNIPMMRHAFLKVNYGSYYVLAGQTSDVFSPLNPTTVNYTVLWNCGNIGYRHPQIQVGNSVTKGLEIVGALSRDMPGDFDGDGTDDGEDSGLPALQARVSWLAAGLNVGVSGHYGQMEYADTKGKDQTADSYSLNLHASYTVSPSVSLMGEAYTGSIMNQYFGAIGQGFDYATEKEIESMGGWFTGTIKPKSGTSLNIGVGLDYPDTDDAKAFPTRHMNRTIFVNVFKDIAPKTTVAIEACHLTTGYWKGPDKKNDVSDIRGQAAFILNF